MKNQIKNIPLARPILTEEEKAAVMSVLESGRYVRGEQNALFEKEFANYCGVKYGVNFSSGTAALHVALLALDVKRGDEVITTPLTFFATVEVIMLCGAKPVFVDIDPDSYNIDVYKIEKAITERTRAIIPVHLYGQPVNMKPLMEIANKKGIPVIEDACQAHGAEYDERKVGSFGDIACFSFYPSKNLMVANEGGASVTNDYSLAERMRFIKDHGKTSPIKHEVVGFNYHLGEVQAAIARIQLKNLDRNNTIRRNIAKNYISRLSKYTDLILPTEISDVKHVYHLFVIQHEKRDHLRKLLADRGIQTGIHYPIPCHKQPAFVNIYGDTQIPIVERIADVILSLPMHQYLAEDEVDYVMGSISEIITSI